MNALLGVRYEYQKSRRSCFWRSSHPSKAGMSSPNHKRATGSAPPSSTSSSEFEISHKEQLRLARTVGIIPSDVPTVHMDGGTLLERIPGGPTFKNQEGEENIIQREALEGEIFKAITMVCSSCNLYTRNGCDSSFPNSSLAQTDHPVQLLVFGYGYVSILPIESVLSCQLNRLPLSCFTTD